MTPRYEVAICGAGPVGMALAALLVARGMDGARIALVDARTLEQAQADPRSLALSYGSRQLLDEIKAWPLAATPIHQIHVSRRGHFGRSLIAREAHGVDALGYVTRYGELVAALAAACARAGVDTLRPARVDGQLEHADGVELQLAGGPRLEAALLVQAEGGLFGEQAARARQHDYRQTAVIARVAVSAPVAHRAYERFTDEGPLALLPQDGADGLQYALVWCARPERAAALLALDDAAFLAALGAAFGKRLGRFVRASARAAFALGLNADPRATARTLAIGNAAQTLHPVAGQGLNLGLRDAAVLARLVLRGETAQFTQARQRDRDVTLGLTDQMARVFTGHGPLQGALGLALGALDALGPARFLLAELMMFGPR
ncbi:MAG: FAD-dependent monooxygenase [Pseudomonadota bacterium]